MTVASKGCGEDPVRECARHAGGISARAHAPRPRSLCGKPPCLLFPPFGLPTELESELLNGEGTVEDFCQVLRNQDEGERRAKADFRVLNLAHWDGEVASNNSEMAQSGLRGWGVGGGGWGTSCVQLGCQWDIWVDLTGRGCT